ncbi:hypothetical protein N9J85_00405 [bacterium]|nr:hypothetical protein [bacterium]
MILKIVLIFILIVFSNILKTLISAGLNVSLTYLRGLEVAELQEEDMPMIGTI